MKSALSRGATGFAALAMTIFGQGSTPTANTRVATARMAPVRLGSPPIRVQQARPPEAGLMEPEPQITPEAPLVVPHPLRPGDCDGEGWSNFTAPKFKDRSACESWIHEHLDPDAGPRLFLFPAPDPSLPGPDRRSSSPLRT